MNEARKLKTYSFIEGIESRAKLLEKGITGAQKVDPKTARRLTQEILDLNTKVKDLVDIS